jgi:uncharacterized protein YjbI with pentapeptide repeats
MTTPGSPPPPRAPLVAKAFEDGGKHYTALSTTFLLACLYVLVAVASTNHRVLLLGGTFSLPLLNVPTSLPGFFVLAPIMLLVLHINLLLQNHVLVCRLQDNRREELGGDEDLLLFPSLPFLDNLWHDCRGFAFLVSAALSSSSIVLPLGVFCYVQYKFVPYHSFKITLWHQVIVVLDLVILWYFFVLIPRRPLNRVGMSIVSACVLVFSFVLAVCPRTWMEAVWTPFPPDKLLARNLSLANESLVNEPPPPELLAAMEKGRLSVGFYSGTKLVDRNLRDADLDGARLFGADLRGADLRGASLVKADLRLANLAPLDESEVTKRRRSTGRRMDIERPRAPARLISASLEGADLRGANLVGSILVSANLRGADLRGACLKGVNLSGADLRDAQLAGANLAGTDLSHAKLDHAQADHANLEKAILAHASLVDASLRNVMADGVSLVEAKMEGAQLTGARLRGGDFRDARLAGSDFRGASLQNAKSLRLEAVDLRGAHLGGLCGLDIAGLTDLRGIDFYSAGNQALQIEAQPQCSGTSYIEYRNLFYNDSDRKGALENWPPAGQLQQARKSEPEFHRQLAAVLLDQACDVEGLAATLFRRAAGEQNPGDLSLDLELARQLTRKLEDPNTCPRLQKLDESRKHRIAWRLRRAERDREWFAGPS